MSGASELQIFISYAHDDDTVRVGASIGRVSGFVDRLGKVISRCTGWPAEGGMVAAGSEPPDAGAGAGAATLPAEPATDAREPSSPPPPPASNPPTTSARSSAAISAPRPAMPVRS